MVVVAVVVVVVLYLYHVVVLVLVLVLVGKGGSGRYCWLPTYCTVLQYFFGGRRNFTHSTGVATVTYSYAQPPPAVLYNTTSTSKQATYNTCCNIKNRKVRIKTLTVTELILLKPAGQTLQLQLRAHQYYLQSSVIILYLYTIYNTEVT